MQPKRILAARTFELAAFALASFASTACGKSPVDAIVPEASGSGGGGGTGGTGTGGGGGDSCAEGVAIASSGLFRLRSAASQCLSVGPSTTVQGSPAHTTLMLDDCAASEIWQLNASGWPGVAGAIFSVQSTSEEENLDIKMGSQLDGTEAITFMPIVIGNQRFVFRPRRARVFEIAPVHVSDQASCLSSAPPNPAIQGCSTTAVDQEWTLLSPDCS